MVVENCLSLTLIMVTGRLATANIMPCRFAIPSLTLSSIIQGVTAALPCSRNLSNFTIELRDEIADALHDTSDTEELQCVEESK